MTETADMARGRAALVSLLAAIVLALALALAFGSPEKAHAASGTVTHVGWEDSITEYGWTQRTRYMELSGQLAICCQHFKGTPPVGTPATTIEPVVTNDLMRKVAWYGWGGPGSLNRLSLVQTACAMSNANNADLTLTGRDAIAVVSDLASPPPSFTLTKWSTGGVSQDLITWTYQPYGGITLNKGSTNADITEGNDCYSLEGAVYGVYRDAACTDLWFTMTTDAGGHASTAKDVDVGTYWVKEISTAKGFALDPAAYQVTVSADEFSHLNVFDVPQGDPVGILLAKHDGEHTYLATDDNKPQGTASLALAQFSFWYFDGFYDTLEEARASGPPTRTWVMQTNEYGYINLRLGDDTFTTKDGVSHPYKVSGDDFYRDTDGTVMIPYGTVFAQETKKPEGYNLNPEVFRAQVAPDGTTGDTVNTYNTPVVPEDVVRGDLEFVKIEDFTQERMGGVPFLLTSVTTGEAHVIVTDANGFASTSASWNAHTSATNANDAAVTKDGENWKVDETMLDDKAGVWFGLAEDGSGTSPHDERGALPHDVYKVDELPCSSNAGHILVSFSITVARDGVTVDGGTVTNDIDHRIDVLKVDAGSGEPLVGAKLKLVRLGDGKVVDEWTSDDAAHIVKDVEAGLYELVETAAPDGYFVAQSMRFSVYETQPVTEVVMENDYTKVDISKTDLTGVNEVEGATLVLRDADGNIVDEWVSGPVPHRIEHLAPGKYILEETIPPATYDQADPVEFTVPESGEVVRVSMKDKPIEISGDLDKLQTIAGEGEAYDYTIDYRSTSNTFADELNLTDPLEVVAKGLARVRAIETPTAVKDADGKMNLWYQTNLNDKDDDADALAHNACASNPPNANNPGNERVTSFTGWVYLGTFSTLESERIETADLGLAEGEYLTALRIEHGRVEEGFSTRTEAGPWDRENRYDIHDNIEAAEVHPHNPESAPLVLHMDIIADSYREGAADLHNSAEMNIVRNKGLVPEKLYDEDRDEVVQGINTKVEISKVDMATSEELPGAELTVTDKETGEVVERWTSTGEPHRIDALAPGEYVLTEVTAPQGYELAESLEFVVEPTGAIQQCSMYDAPSSEVTKTAKSYFDKTGDWLLANWLAVAGIALVGGALAAAGLRLMRTSKRS